MSTRGREFLTILGLAAVYDVAARLGLAFDAVSGFATLIWPPTGIALAAVLLLGYRLWPGVFLGASIALDALISTLISASIGIAGNRPTRASSRNHTSTLFRSRSASLSGSGASLRLRKSRRPPWSASTIPAVFSVSLPVAQHGKHALGSMQNSMPSTCTHRFNVRASVGACSSRWLTSWHQSM